MAGPSEVIKAKELAEYLGIGVQEIYSWIKMPEFPAIPNGETGYRILRTPFMNWYADPKNIIEFKRALEEKRRKS